MRLALCATSAVILGCLGSAPAFAQRDLTPLDVVSLKSVGSVYPSPDGRQIAFTRVAPRAPQDPPGGSYVGLYLMGPDGAEHTLVAGRRTVRGVAWHPSGTLTFLENGTVVALLPDAEGPEPVLEEGGIAQFRWRPDGAGVAFTAATQCPPHALRHGNTGSGRRWLRRTGTRSRCISGTR